MYFVLYYYDRYYKLILQVDIYHDCALERPSSSSICSLSICAAIASSAHRAVNPFDIGSFSETCNNLAGSGQLLPT